MSSLVGRGLEIAAVRERLRTARVVTLTGPGGCGQTRLALRVAALAAGDGAWLVELAPLTDPALVPATVVQALGVSERDMLTPAAGLVRALAGRELLVVLDNCEHVLEAAAGLVATLLAQCRRVRFLATSGERLDVLGELAFPVPSPRPRPPAVRGPGCCGQSRLRAVGAQLGCGRTVVCRAGRHPLGHRTGRGQVLGSGTC